MIKCLSSFSLPADFSLEQRQSIEADRIDLLFRQSPMGILGTLGCVILMIYILQHQITNDYLIIWFSMAMVSVLMRALLVYRYFHRNTKRSDIQRWGQWNIITLGYSGIVWAAAPIMIFPMDSVPHQFFLTLVICGMVAGASMAFAVMLRAFLIFTIPAIAALVLRMVTMDTDLHLAVGILAILYWGLSLLISVNIRKTRLQLLILKENLADRVARRTAELQHANEQLKTEIQQRIDAQEAQQRIFAKLETARKLEAIATLAGGVAHQFNNALSVIIGALELLRDDAEPGTETEEHIQLISQSVGHMSGLTSQLLAYARGGKYKSQSADVPHFIKNTLALLEHTFSPAIDVRLELEPDLPNFEIDETQMTMAVSAIIANACEAMTAGGQLTIICRSIPINAEESNRYENLSPGRYIIITIKDSGTGMAPETLNRIFEPFFSTKFQGRGLAMAAVYGIIQSHNGHVAVTSQKETGTQVDLFLPAIDTLTPSPATHQNHIKSIQDSATVLLIEDEAGAMAVNKAFLRRIGYDVVCADSGQEALILIRDPAITFDLVLLDITLPDMDGTLLFPEILRHRPQARIVICNDYALDASTQTLIDAGAHGFIQKPFSLHALAKLLGQSM